MARYIVTIELFDLVDVAIEGPDDASYTDLIHAVGDRFSEEGLPEVDVQPNYRTVRVVRKTEDSSTVLYL